MTATEQHTTHPWSFAPPSLPPAPLLPLDEDDEPERVAATVRALTEDARTADRIVGEARLAFGAKRTADRVTYAVCVCTDGEHGAGWSRRICEHPSEAIAHAERIDGSHVVRARHIHITCPKDVIA